MPTRVAAGVESENMRSFFMFKIIAVWSAWEMASISGIVEEEVSRDEEEKFKWGDWGPKEVENAAPRTPFAT